MAETARHQCTAEQTIAALPAAELRGMRDRAYRVALADLADWRRAQHQGHWPAVPALAAAYRSAEAHWRHLSELARAAQEREA